MRMTKKLRAFLEANGLPQTATEREADEFYRQLQVGGISYVGREYYEDVEPALPQDPAPAIRGADPVPAIRGAAPVPEPPAPAEPARSDAPDIKTEVADALRAERLRVDEIGDICRHFDLPEATTRELIANGATVDAARKAALDHLRQTNQAFGGRAATSDRASLGMEDGDRYRAAAIDGVLLQTGRRLDQPAEGAGDFRAMSPLDLARESLERAGVRTRGMSRMQIASRALTPTSTSDFPLLLGGIGRETLLAAYNEAPQTWRPLVETSSAVDFRDMYVYAFKGAPELKPLLENGEYETAEFGEGGERYRLVTRGVVFPYTRQMLINDDWGIFTRVVARFGAAARRMESAMVYDELTGTGKMSDGKTLFHADHDNLLTAAALSADSLETAITKLWETTGHGGEELDLQPRYLLVSPANFFKAQVLIGSTSSVAADMSAGVINPLHNMVQVIADSRVRGDQWFLFADPAQAPVLQVAWLDGNEAPFVDEEVDFMTDGIRVKARHDFGVGKVSWIGAVRNPGE